MKKQLKKMLALALVLCLMVLAVPVAASAEDSPAAVPEVPAEPEQSATQSDTLVSTATETEEVTVLWEDETLRGEYEKHFLMSDGSYQAVVYSYPVHELVDGVWVEIESTNQNARGDVSPDSARSNIIDNYVWENQGVQDNNAVRLYIGRRSNYRMRAFIRFATMPTIPEGATITKATMTVNIVSGTSTAYNASAYQVAGAWESGTIQWSNMPNTSTLQASNISHNNKTKYQFSCLEAVKDWYTGSTTGQNGNYGIMLKYNDETIADYNSFYSADCADANSRPALTISYTPANNEISVLEGYTKQLTVPDTTGTITWISSDIDVATVDSAGKVTGIKAGKATITASVSDTEIHTYMVYVIIEKGVYRIDNQNGSLYLTVNGGAMENAVTNMQMETTEELPMLRQLWRVTYLAGGYYVIRPMHNQNMALHAKDGVSDVTTIGYNNTLSGVPAENRWTIEYLDNGYVFKCQGDSEQALRYGANYPGVSVGTAAYDDSIGNFKWYFDDAPYIGPQLLMLDTLTGTLVTNNIFFIDPGQTMTPLDMNMAISMVCTNVDNQNLTWYSSDNSVEIDSATGEITAVTPGGIATIYARYNHNGTWHEKWYRVHVKPDYDNTFFIRSGNLDSYIQLDSNYSSGGNDNSAAIIEQWEFTGGKNQMWLIQPCDDGYSSIISKDTGKALSVPQGYEIREDIPLIQEQYTGNDRQLWKITETDKGYYKIKAKSSENAGVELVIAVEDSIVSGTNGLNIVQKLYVNDDDYEDEWLLAKIGYASEVQVEGQQQSMWCWVTCARMFAKHFYPNVSYTQTQAVEHVFGEVKNEGGNIEHTQKAIDFYVSNIPLAHIDTKGYDFYIYSKETLLRFLDDGYVVKVGRGEYLDINNKNSLNTAHASLIYGYVTIGTEYRFLVRDSWPVNEGTSYMMSYEKLCNGRYPQPGEAPDLCIWDSIIAVNTSYVDEKREYYFFNQTNGG